MRLTYHYLLLVCGICGLAISVVGNQRADAQTSLTASATVGPGLTSQLGFNTTALDNLERQGMRQVDQHVTFSAYGHTYHLVHVWPLTEDQTKLGFGQVVLFQVDGTDARLLWKYDADAVYPQLSGDKSLGQAWPVPGDWEHNEQIEFGIYWNAINTCPVNFSYLDIFVLHRDGSVTARLTRQLIPAGHVVEGAESEKSGALLLTIEDIRGFYSGMNFSSCTGPVFRRHFELKGAEATDVSIWYRRYYLEQIDFLVVELTRRKASRIADPNVEAKRYAGELIELLMSFDILKQRDYGYSLMKSLATHALSADQIQSNTYLDQVFLPAMKQLYDQKQPFIPPEFVGPHPEQEAVPFYR